MLPRLVFVSIACKLCVISLVQFDSRTFRKNNPGILPSIYLRSVASNNRFYPPPYSNQSQILPELFQILRQFSLDLIFGLYRINLNSVANVLKFCSKFAALFFECAGQDAGCVPHDTIQSFVRLIARHSSQTPQGYAPRPTNNLNEFQKVDKPSSHLMKNNRLSAIPLEIKSRRLSLAPSMLLGAKYLSLWLHWVCFSLLQLQPLI